MGIHKNICNCIQQHFNNVFHNANLTRNRTLTSTNVAGGMSGGDKNLSSMFRPWYILPVDKIFSRLEIIHLITKNLQLFEKY